MRRTLLPAAALSLALLGALAMRPRFPRARRVGFYLAALATYAAIFGIARMHQPLGWLLLLR